jgi:hypothetical protein
VPIFPLKLQETYYSTGYFNVTVDFDRFVRSSEGHIELLVGESRKRIDGRISRAANTNGTARIYGGSELRDWFQKHHRIGDIVSVDLQVENTIHIY